MSTWTLAACKVREPRKHILWFAYRRQNGKTQYAEDEHGKIRTWTNRDDAAESLETMELEPAAC
jgi:hypothetical protein